jgi:glucuronate isomerase
MKTMPLMLHPDRFFSSDPAVRSIARSLYQRVKDLPIISPHGHVDPRLFVLNEPFANPTELFIIPDHYIFRMLHSQGIDLNTLGIPHRDGIRAKTDPRKVWQIFAENYFLFRGTPSGVWLNHEFAEIFGIKERLTADSAMRIYDTIDEQLHTPEFLPRRLFERFNIALLTTTDAAFDTLEHHKAMRASGWKGNVVPCFRPDSVTNLLNPTWKQNIEKLAAASGIAVTNYKEYIAALENRRAYFKLMGAVSTDHGVFSAFTHRLSDSEAEAMFVKGLKGTCTADDAALFTAHMLMEMARMSVDDGLVMQIHPGVHRNHCQQAFEMFGPDKGFDIPVQGEFTSSLKELLNAYGTNPKFAVIVFTVDETTYARELAPLAGVYPAMKLGPAWWFDDSIEGMRRFRHMTTENAGIYNTAGFNDDTRAFVSIPARHDLSRRVDCDYLGHLVAEHLIEEDEAEELASEMANGLAKKAYRVESL